LAAFERKAGSPFLNCFVVSLLKKSNCFKSLSNNIGEFFLYKFAITKCFVYFCYEI